jgi:uncharacterized damage-inducible protein DinB
MGGEMELEMKWFDRSFAFDLEPWIFPNLVERLRGTPARVEELIHGLAPERITRRHGGSWSIQEHVGHLYDLEELWTGRIDDLLERKAVLRPADLTNRKTHEADHNAGDIQAILASLRAARAALVARLDGCDRDAVLLEALHPRLDQPMRLLDLVYFVAEHDDHHLAQITRLKRS